ncbi:MAG: hypothetical protein GXO73_08800 [Calditrichaeota bacterium]|nr:hypothetical protein [Calditrichota bacterium]
MAKITRLELLDGLKLAIQLETDLRRFYEAAIESEEIPANKELLEKILEEENKHRKLFQKRYEDLTGNKLLYLNVNKRRRLVELLSEPTAADKILEEAKENEKRSIEFYENASSLVPPGWLRQTFLELAEEERKHLELLTGEYRETEDLEVPDNGRPKKSEVHAA